MQASKDRQLDDLPVAGAHRGHRRPLAEALVRACGVEVADVLGDHAVQMPVVEHQDMVEALATQRAEKAFADGVHVGRAHRRADYPDAGSNGQRIEGNPKLVVSVANQQLRCHAEGVALRSCCATHACDGMRVVAANTTLRVASSMNTSVKMGRKNKS